MRIRAPESNDEVAQHLTSHKRHSSEIKVKIENGQELLVPQHRTTKHTAGSSTSPLVLQYNTSTVVNLKSTVAVLVCASTCALKGIGQAMYVYMCIVLVFILISLKESLSSMGLRKESNSGALVLASCISPITLAYLKL